MVNVKSRLEKLFAEPFAGHIVELRQSLAAHPETWQHRLQTPSELAGHCSKFGIGGVNEGVVMGLWRFGLLRADVVTSESELRMDGLVQVHSTNGVFTYCDLRRVPSPENGLSSALDTSGEPDGLAVHFHPFRAYVVHQVANALELRMSPFQFVTGAEGVLRIANRHIDDLNHWSASPASRERIAVWNSLAEMPSRHSRQHIGASSTCCEPVSA
jgi:hypothetical protein